MANASDPLLEMFTTDVDEKAVSELVGSLESRLSRQRPTVLNSHAQQAQQHPQQQQQQQPPDRGGGRLGAAAAAGGGASKAAAPDLGEAEARSGTLGPTMKRTAATGILLLHQQQQQYQQLQQQQVGETNCQRHGGVVAPGVSVAASSAASVAAALASSLSASSASSLSSTSSLLSAAASSSSSSSSSASLSSPSTSLTQASSLTQSSLSAAASTCSSSSFSSQSSSVSAPASSSSSTTSASLSNHADVPVLPLGRTPVTQTVGSAGQPLNGGFVYGTPAGGGGGAVVGGGVGVVSPARTSSISSGGNSNNGVALSVVAVDSGRMNFNVTASTNLNPNVAPNPIITATTTIITTTASTNPSVTSTNPNAATTAATSNPALTPCPGAGTPPTIALQRPPASHNGAPNSIVSTSSIISTSSSSNISSSNSTGHPPLMCTTPAGVVSGQPSVISAVASRPAITLISSQQQQQQQAAIVPTLAPSVAGMVPLAGGHSGMVRVSVPPPPSPGPALSPARPGLALQQRLLPPQIIAPRPQTIQLPPGFTLPPGTVMVRAGEQGQLFLIQQSVLAQAGGAAPHAAPVPPSSTVAHAPSPPAASPATQPQQGVRLAALQIAPVTPPVGGAPTLAAATPAPPAVPALPTSQPPLVFTPEVMENVKKCKNFLSTLIKLASSGQQSPETTRNVKELVQNLLDAKMEPEEFTSRLQKELKSSPQPYLVPFLKKSLPAVRYLAQNPQAPTQAVPQLNAIGTPTTSTSAARPLGAQTHAAQAPLHTVLTTQHGGGVKQIVLQSQARGSTQIKPGTVVRAQGPALIRPPPTGVPGATGLQASASQKGKMKDLGGGTFKDDDDINDVASMAGVNINEESARIAATGSDTVGTQIRSCRDEAFLSAGPLQRRLLDIGRRYGVTEVPADVVGLVSHAAQERLKNLVERLSVIAQHRTETYRDSDDSEQMSDVRSQLRFFEQLDRLEKQRKDEQEREILLRAAKSRSRQEDPEQARLKQKAKEMQQAELAQMRQREANLTALAAIGPRKKRKLDSPGPGTPGEAGGGGPGASSSGGAVSAGGSDGGAAAAVAGPGGGGGGGGGGVPGTPTRPSQRARFTRVNLRDLIFLLEQDRETAHSLVLYRAQLK